MPDNKKLNIIKGEEFKVNIQKEIDEKDIFYDQYAKAAQMLDDIVMFDDAAASADWLKTESENNIIAFCGERGEGKSSAMISFINAVHSLNSNADCILFSNCKNVIKTLFSEPMVMDPSMFDDVHNVLDIVLATLYKKFREKYDIDNQCLGVDDREKLLNQFQKVYRSVSLINNQAQMLDNEYDYEGNISKLSKLGESTGLRNELKQLIKLYLDFMLRPLDSDKKRKSLLIAIDDLDLCSSNAYKMAEQIRKYLMIPNVVIVMAIKVEQLRLCVLEENYRNFKKILKVEAQKSGIIKEISDMAERYIAKLIPRARRIYLPKVQTIHDARILYRDKTGDIIYEGSVKDSMNEAVLEYVFLRTGMRFLINKSEENYLLPDNLRDMINMITLLGDMEEPKGNDSIYSDNIQKFCSYFEKEWLPGNLNTEDCKEIQKLIQSNYIRLHGGTEFTLRNSYNSTEKKLDSLAANYFPEMNYSFFRVINWLEAYYSYVFGNTEEKYAYAFHILYTIRLNELLRNKEYDEMTRFMGGYMWAGSFTNILQNVQGNAIDRSRFVLPTILGYNTIAKMLNSGTDILLPGKATSQYYVSKISEKDENREEKILAWLLLGLLSNTYMNNQLGQVIYTFHNVPVVYSNHSLLSNVHISLENYMVGLCNLTSLYEKINMEALGVGRQEFDKFVINIEKYNKDTIEVFRKILTNIDMALKFKENCHENVKSKEGGFKDEAERTKAAVDRFFGNIEKFMMQYGGIDEQVKIHPLILQYDEKENKREVDIGQLYGLLVQASVQNFEDEQMNVKYAKKGAAAQEFLSKLRENSEFEIPQKTVSTFLRNKSAENAKLNMDNLASNIQKYNSENPNEGLKESEINELRIFYNKIMDYYLDDSSKNISEELYEEYKRIVSKYDR